ncbi:hypothetical protein PYCCODRAFT_1430670 [Trametes coccinea BRFM310]|uniref:F-box domain-containing protein n=1 Tax=Trametes coccinea (strain BRFM310) TaxID=1353009 RepID=A0A1Y2J5E7_TRAC3|nr:hypothetical protein PYCCODRAFT_1430670 [Trametes coccinea BRFM310]
MSCERLISLTIDIDPAVGVEPVHLPLLEELDLSRQYTTGAEASYLDVDSFAVWRLPRLSRVVLPVATHRYSGFLRQHGKTITYLEFRSHWLWQGPPRPWIWGDFTSCPKLRHLVLDDHPTGTLSEDQLLAHPNLKYIDFWANISDPHMFCDMRAKHTIAPNVPWQNVRLLDPALKQLGQLPTLFPPDSPSCELPSFHSVLDMSIVHTEWAVYRSDLPTFLSFDFDEDSTFVPSHAKDDSDTEDDSYTEDDSDTEDDGDTEDDSDTEAVDSESDDRNNTSDDPEGRDRDGDERGTEDAGADVHVE